MSNLPEACIEAASCQTRTGVERGPEARASRVILALAENLPEHSIGKALSAFYANGVETCSTREAIRAAIAAFLKHVAGETP